MIELKSDGLVFSFPEVHKHARIEVGFQRTLRIPDDDKKYPLPPGLGRFPLRHVDDFAERVPERWLERGGVMLPMYQSEALWVNFSGLYPFAVKVAAGKINAVTGDEWTDDLQKEPQDYMVPPDQPWLDGYCVEKGIIRQFVAMPLAGEYTVEAQITGEAEHGGIQIIAYPMSRKAYNKRFERPQASLRHPAFGEGDYDLLACEDPMSVCLSADMGLAAGGQMEQEIFDDPYKFKEWDQEHSGRCFVHLANSLAWRSITQEEPPTVPFTSREYNDHGLPWFDYYGGDLKALKGGEGLKGIKSVLEIGKKKGETPLPENEPVDPDIVIQLRKGLGRDEVRDGRF